MWFGISCAACEHVSACGFLFQLIITCGKYGNTYQKYGYVFFLASVYPLGPSDRRGINDESPFVFPPKANDKCYTCAFNYAITWPQNPSEELH